MKMAYKKWSVHIVLSSLNLVENSEKKYFAALSKQAFGFSDVWNRSLDMQRLKKSLQDPVGSLLKWNLNWSSSTKVVKLIVAHANCKHTSAS